MDTTNPGPRDHVVTRAIARALSEVDDGLVDVQSLDAAEAPERLARHTMDELRVALDGEKSVDRQAAQVNAILRTLDASSSPDAEVSLPARVVVGIKGRSALGDVVP